MSKNNIYFELQDKVYKRYIKAHLAALSGMRVNPHDIKARIPFLLVTPEDSVNWKADSEGYLTPDGTKEINYGEEVLEIYSEQEDTVFRRINPLLFKEGLLVEYSSGPTEIGTENQLSESELVSICSVTHPKTFRSKIKNITSSVTLERIEAKLLELDKRPSFKRELDAYRSTLL